MVLSMLSPILTKFPLRPLCFCHQVHNWATELSGGAPSLEFVAPTKIYVVVNGVKVHLELGKVPVRQPCQYQSLD